MLPAIPNRQQGLIGLLVVIGALVATVIIVGAMYGVMWLISGVPQGEAYVKGIVQDSDQQPIPEQTVVVNNTGWGWFYDRVIWDKAYIESDQTDLNGRFEITFSVGRSAHVIVDREGYERYDGYHDRNSDIVITLQRKPQPTSPTPTPYPIPVTVVPKESTTTNSLSPGLFYPFTHQSKTNNSSPTIIGRIQQTPESIFLSTKLTPEVEDYGGFRGPILRFVPGRVKDLEVLIDGHGVKDVFGFAQYPGIVCSNNEGTINFTTVEDCLHTMSEEIPPLVFVFKPTRLLSTGEHTLTLRSNGQTIDTQSFSVDPKLSVPLQAVPERATGLASAFSSDNCSSGYYHDVGFLHIPLVAAENDNLYYGVSFPQGVREQKTELRRVQLGFENFRYDLFFPTELVFFADKPNPYPHHNLFIPENNLYFANGSKAIKVTDKTKGTDITLPYLTQSYFEIYPIDISGRGYFKNALPWTESGSSSCDG